MRGGPVHHWRHRKPPRRLQPSVCSTCSCISCPICCAIYNHLLPVFTHFRNMSPPKIRQKGAWRTVATITTRERSNGTKSYRAEIKLKRKGKVVYQESRTFDRKALAKDWASRRELELQEPDALNKVMHRGVTIGELIERYQKEFGASFGRSKTMDMARLREYDLAKLDAIEVNSQD